jgi:hypothetical protein
MPEKEWPGCQVCRKPVSTAQGRITIYRPELSLYTQRYREWEADHAHGYEKSLDGEEVSDVPPRVAWHWGHAECLEEGMFEIPYARFNTIEKAMAWTLHLMKKPWFKYTNWDFVIKSHYDLPNL